MTMNRSKLSVFCLVCGVLLCGLALTNRPNSGRAEDRPANESASDAALEWRYPGGKDKYTRFVEKDEIDVICFDFCTIDASLEDVLKFYCKRCGREDVFGRAFRKLEPQGNAPARYAMVIPEFQKDRWDFAWNSARVTVHVTVQRRADKKFSLMTVVSTH